VVDRTDFYSNAQAYPALLIDKLRDAGLRFEVIVRTRATISFPGMRHFAIASPIYAFIFPASLVADESVISNCKTKIEIRKYDYG